LQFFNDTSPLGKLFTSPARPRLADVWADLAESGSQTMRSLFGPAGASPVSATLLASKGIFGPDSSQPSQQQSQLQAAGREAAAGAGAAAATGAGAGAGQHLGLEGISTLDMMFEQADGSLSFGAQLDQAAAKDAGITAADFSNLSSIISSGAQKHSSRDMPPPRARSAKPTAAGSNATQQQQTAQQTASAAVQTAASGQQGGQQCGQKAVGSSLHDAGLLGGEGSVLLDFNALASLLAAGDTNADHAPAAGQPASSAQHQDGSGGAGGRPFAALFHGQQL
jgi:hypothetical protein